MLMRRALVVIGLLTGMALLTVSPAGAQARLSVSPGTGLDPAGSFVVVSGSGFEPNSQLFVMQCRSTSTDDHTCNSVGLRKVTTDGSGNFTANAMRVMANFGATDCLVVPCAIKTSAVSGHAGNRGQDVTAPISFNTPAPAPTEPPPVVPVEPPSGAVPPPVDPPGGSPEVVEAPDREDAPTTTADPGTTETTDSAVDATSTTTTPDDEDDPDDGEVDGAAAPTDLAGPGSDTDGDGGSSGALLIGVVVVIFAAAAAGAVAVRRRAV